MTDSATNGTTTGAATDPTETSPVTDAATDATETGTFTDAAAGATETRSVSEAATGATETGSVADGGAGAAETGTIAVRDGVATMTFRRRLPYPPEVVWAALTDPAERAGWFGTTVLEPREGGTIEMIPAAPDLPSPDMKRMTGRILVWDPPRVLEHEWRQQVIDDGVVRYELEPDGGVTLLTFTHQGLSAANARGYIPGTHAYLDRLAAHLAGHPIPDWQTRYDEMAPHYKAWR